MKPTEPPVPIQSVTGERTELELLPFPASIELAGQELVLRHMQADDGAAILRFAKALPQRDLLFLRRDITDRADVEAWVADALAGQTPTILTFVGPQLIGYVPLAAERVPWARHVAEVRALIAPEWRRSGLGGLLVSQAVARARREGHVKLIAQMTYDQGGAFGAFIRLGFVQEASLPERVMDRDGRLHALRVLGLNVAAFQAPATTLIDAARSSQERTLRWHGTAELLDPNGIVVAEVAAELWKLSLESGGARWGGELTAPAAVGLRWGSSEPPSELRLADGRSAQIGSLGAVRMDTARPEATHVVQLTGKGAPPF